MRSMLVLLAVLAMSLAGEVQSFLRVSTVHQTQERDDPPSMKDIGTAIKGAGEKVEKATVKKVEKAGKEAAKDEPNKVEKKDSIGAKAKKKMMDPIESMRAMMCWGRKNLIEHEECMGWMAKHCKKETSGEGYCKKLRRYVKSKCRKGSQKACDYATDLGIKMEEDKEQFDPDDEDGDGVKDKDDAFPDNPMESKDSDGDGVGDNSDKWPNDPTCSDEGDICGATSPAPAPAMPPAPGGMAAAPIGLTMDENVPLPSQGYNEYSADYVAHDDGKTMTRDWGAEWPHHGGSEEGSIKNICDKNPNHAWCKLKQSKGARKAYAASHP